jgi:hypothetical protein
MRFKTLSQLKRPERLEVVLAALPQQITMTRYAMAKASKITELVRIIFKESFEWYGLTLADRGEPETISDIGLPQNAHNLQTYTVIGPEGLAEYCESLAPDLVINGWIHSHGSLEYRHFSKIDEENHLAVLDLVNSRLRRPVAKREIPVQDLALLVKDHFTEKDLQRGSVSLIADAPVREVKILETVYGGFSYSIVIGDDGWHEQEIHYKEQSILSGQTTVYNRRAEIILVDGGRSLTQADVSALRREVEERIRPHTDPPPEMIERM